MHVFRVVWVVVLALAAGSFSDRALAQQVRPRYEIPCQSRAQFVSRLRGLVQNPNRVELDILQFSIEVTQDSETPDSPWTLVVRKQGAESNEPRSVRDASCQDLAEAAALVVSIWIDETPTRGSPLPPPNVSVPEPSAYPLEQANAPDEPDEPHAPSFGVTLNADGALQLSPNPSLGTSLEAWRLSARSDILHAIGIRWWPAHTFRAALSSDSDYQVPIGELYYSFSWEFIHFGVVKIGPWVAGHLGFRRVLGEPETVTFRMSLGIVTDVAIADGWGIVVRAALGGSSSDRVEPSATLGLRRTLF